MVATVPEPINEYSPIVTPHTMVALEPILADPFAKVVLLISLAYLKTIRSIHCNIGKHHLDILSVDG